MSQHLHIGKIGLVVAAILGGFHLWWSILILLGWAQPVIDFVFWLHFIKPVYVIEPFEAGRAAMLVAMTAAMGFGIGLVFACIWNIMHRASVRAIPSRT